MSDTLADFLRAQNSPAYNELGLISSSLAGLAQGFAQGGMPVPIKGGIPFGATIGNAAAGMQQGLNNDHSLCGADLVALGPAKSAPYRRAGPPVAKLGLNPPKSAACCAAISIRHARAN